MVVCHSLWSWVGQKLAEEKSFLALHARYEVIQRHDWLKSRPEFEMFIKLFVLKWSVWLHAGLS